MPTQNTKENLDASESNALSQSGTAFVSEQKRPLYFDGRFLTAADLTAEQTYFLKRQAALNRANGFGVIRGLEVSRSLGTASGSDASRVIVAPGSGVTPSGDVVTIENSLPINLADTARIERLDATFGLLQQAQDSARSQTGLFILGLRSVEYSASPTASYPTSSTGTSGITQQNGEIVEATAVTLVRYGDTVTSVERSGNRARSQIARDIFVNGTIPDFPVDLLPLAMISLQQNTVQWIDNFLVRRELGSSSSATLGLNAIPRALRSAHLQQYNQQFEDLQASGSTFSANSFDALPAAGQLPKSGINPTDFSQTFFPADVKVNLTIAPTDEIIALIEDSLALPPIDLRENASSGTSNLETLSLLVVIPMTRQQINTFRQSLAAATASPLAGLNISRTLNLAAPGIISKRSPLERLARLDKFSLPVFSSRPIPLPTADTAADTADSLWRKAIEAADKLWYVRQRNIPYQAEIVGTAIAIAGNDTSTESALVNRLDSLNLGDRFNNLNTSLIARAEAVSLLSAPRLARSDLLLRSALRDLEIAPTITASTAPTAPTDGTSVFVPPPEPSTETPSEPTPPRPIDRADVLRVAERFGDPRLGEGLSRLEAADSRLTTDPTVVNTLANSGNVVALDQIARNLTPAELTSFSRELTTVARGGSTVGVNSLIRNRLEGIR